MVLPTIGPQPAVFRNIDICLVHREGIKENHHVALPLGTEINAFYTLQEFGIIRKAKMNQ